MVIAVMADLTDGMDPVLVEIPDGASKEKIGEEIEEQAGFSPNFHGYPIQKVEIDPSVEKRLKDIKWPHPIDDDLTEGQMAIVSMCKALVCTAFAKGGPVAIEISTDVTYGEEIPDRMPSTYHPFIKDDDESIRVGKEIAAKRLAAKEE